MDHFNFSQPQSSIPQISSYNLSPYSSYSPQRNLESQPAYIIGALIRESVDGILSNVSHAIGYVSENFSYYFNNFITPYQANNDLPPIIEVSGLTSNITSFDSKDSDFALLVQNLDAQFVSQNKIENDRLSVKVANINATFTNIFLKDIDQDPSTTALCTSSAINLTDVISLYAPTLLPEIPPLTLNHIKNKYIVSSSSSVKSQKTNDVDTLLIHEATFLYNPKKPDLTFSEAGDLFEKLLDADKNLSPEILAYFGNKLFEQYPFISGKPCKNLLSDTTASISDIILSRTYSAYPEETEVKLNQAMSTYAQFSYTRDMINALSVSIAGGDAYSAVPSDNHYSLKGASYAVHRAEPLKIVHCQNTEEMTQHSEDKETLAPNKRGYYCPEFNVVTFKGELSDTPNAIFAPAFIHESSHAVMNRLFKNGCQPFFKTDENQKASYEQAELAVFKNLAEKLNIVEDGIYDFSTTQMAIKAIVHSEVLHTLITEEGNEMISKLKVTEEDFMILSELHSLIYHYGEGAISTELIVRIPQLLTQGVSATTLESYFKPLMNYWNTSITPEVTKIIEGKPSSTSGYLLSF